MENMDVFLVDNTAARAAALEKMKELKAGGESPAGVLQYLRHSALAK